MSPYIVYVFLLFQLFHLPRPWKRADLIMPSVPFVSQSHEIEPWKSWKEFGCEFWLEGAAEVGDPRILGGLGSSSGEPGALPHLDLTYHTY